MYDLVYYELSRSCRSHVCCLCLLNKVSEKQGTTAFTLWLVTDRQVLSYLVKQIDMSCICIKKSYKVLIRKISPSQVCLICYRSPSIVKFLNKFFRASSACISNTKAAVSTAEKDGCFFKELLYKPNHEKALCLACLQFGAPNKMTPLSNNFICSIERLDAHPFFSSSENQFVCTQKSLHIMKLLPNKTLH